MKNIMKIAAGHVITLPKYNGHGVILSSTRMKNNWYKVTILEDDGDIAVCKLKAKEDGEHLWYRSYTRFNAVKLCVLLSSY